jgi:hypothetical protein
MNKYWKENFFHIHSKPFENHSRHIIMSGERKIQILLIFRNIHLLAIGILLFQSMLSEKLHGQDFVLQNQNFMPLSHSINRWADYDVDGDLDLILAGMNADSNYHTLLYENDETTFVLTNINLPVMQNPSMDWGDYDNDGDPDLLVGGQNEANTSLIYTNENGVFMPGAEFFGIGEDGVVLFIDWDNDGDLDVFASGGGNTGIYIQQEGNSFSLLAEDLPLFETAQADAGDYDNDGDNDLIVSGETEDGLQVYLLKNETFNVAVIEMSLPGWKAGSMDWGDYDNDGDLDLLVLGVNAAGNSKSEIYRNDGDDNFVNIYAGLSALSLGEAAWGDYDNDGDLDVAEIGYMQSCGLAYGTYIYENIGNDWFNVKVNDFWSGEYASIAWGDYDNDGDLDLVLSGVAGGANYSTLLYRNQVAFPLSLPSVPQGLTVTQMNMSTLLAWNKSTDSQTPSEGLTYNLRLGTASGLGDIVSPSSIDEFRMIPECGNLGHDTSVLIQGLENATTYYWSIQAVENSFNASSFSEEKTFVTNWMGNNENSTSYFDVFPNPVENELQLKLNSEVKTMNASIFNSLGECVKSATITGKIIPVDDLKNGVYFLRIETEKENFSSRFLKGKNDD